MLIGHPGLSAKAAKFAKNQNIVVYTLKGLESVIGAKVEKPLAPVDGDVPSSFNNDKELLNYLKSIGYEIEEGARVRGRCGVSHTLDIFAHMDDGIISHSVDIGIFKEGTELTLEQALLFDAMAFNVGAHNKVIITTASMGAEGKKF